jgi:transcriptional regulator with XRE-family HTH domain
MGRRGAGIDDDMDPILPIQCWIARTALGWSVRKLALAADVSRDTVVRFERGDELKASTVEAIQEALERAGVFFIDAKDGGPGARLQR